MIPVLRREFLGILRSPRALAALLAAAVAFSLLILARWPAGGIVDLSGTGSRGAFLVFAAALLGGVLLLVPAFPASSIVRERNQGTLLLLFNSPIPPIGIYAGKFLGVLAFAGLVLCTTLPAAAAVYAMGGVDPWRQIALLYAVILVVAILSIAIGLLVSTRATSPDAAVRITYGLVFAVAFLTLCPHALTRGTSGLFATIADWLRRLSPLPVVMHLVGQGGAVGGGLLEKDSGVWQFLAGGLGLAAVLAVATILQLDHRLFDRSRDAGKITDDRSLWVRIVRRLVFLVDPQRRKAGIPFYLNPIMVKEFRTRRFGRFHWLLRLAAGCAVVSLLMTLAATNGTMDWGVETIGGLLVILQIALVVLLTPSLAAGLIASERERGGWSLLRSTTLPGWRIATGKLTSVAWTMLLVLAATLPGYLVMTTIKPTMWNQVMLALVSVLLAVAMTLALSAAIGAFHSRTAAATVTVYVVLMILYLGPLVIWAFRGDPFGEQVVRWALSITPLGAALSVIGMPGFTQYELIPIAWRIAGAICVASLIVYALQVWRLLRPE